MRTLVMYLLCAVDLVCAVRLATDRHPTHLSVACLAVLAFVALGGVMLLGVTS